MARKSIKPQRGFNLVELFVTLAIFGFLMTIAMATLTQSLDVYRKTSGRDNLARAMTKAWSALRKDLSNASLNLGTTLDVQKVPGSLAASAADGDAISFLSPADPVSGELMNAPDGSAFYMRQVTYYLVVPANHDILMRQHCVGGADAEGYEEQCPHKVLVRRRDNPKPTPDPTKPATIDVWNPGWQTLLTRPASLASANDDYKIVATNLLSFRFTRDKLTGALDTTNGVLHLDLRAVAVDEAQRNIGVGKTPLGTGPYTIQQLTAVVPRNN